MMDSPYRTSAEPYVEPKPDGLEVMRRERAQRHGRIGAVLLFPVAIAVLIICPFVAATNIVGFQDGVPFGMRQPFVLAGLVLAVALVCYAGWHHLPRALVVLMVLGSLVVSGLWMRRDVRVTRERRAALALSWCQTANTPDTELPACITRTTRCLAADEHSSGDPSVYVIRLGNPCDRIDDE